MKNLPEKLYHYCPSEAFYGIITSKTLWLSNSIYSNDPNDNRMHELLLAEISKYSTDKELRGFISQIMDDSFGPIDNISAYVFCMTEKKEDLNQWRLYGDYGQGYTIEFCLKNYIDNQLWIPLKIGSSLPEYDSLYLAKCEYDFDTQMSLVLQFLTLILNSDRIIKEDKIFYAKRFLKFFSSFFKHQSYKDEQEWRLICFPNDCLANQHVKIKHKLKFRVRRGLIVQYVEQKFDSDINFPDVHFDTITLGPNVINSDHEIANFMELNGMRYRKINTSNLKMRISSGTH